MFPLTAIPWRLIGAGALVAGFMLAGWRVSAWHSAYKAYPTAMAALKAEEECAVGSKCAVRQAAQEARQAEVSKEVISGYEKELADLRNRPVPTRVIRVCPAPGDVRDAKSTAGTDAARTGAGLVHGEVEFDTRPLRDLAREADEVSARLRALQGFNEALAKPAGKQR